MARKRRTPNQGVSRGKKPVRPNSGARNGRAQLSTADVLAIRELRGELTVAEIAARYRITPGQVSKIQLRRQWSHLP